MEEAPFIGVSRHRLIVDGEGVTTLAAFHTCTLKCKYCLNPQSLRDIESARMYSTAELYEKVKVDELYFLATGGGICFGGGEPCLRYEFIKEFRELCGDDWKLTIETALNVPKKNIEALLPVIDYWFVDIKDMNPAIYEAYTGKTNANVIEVLGLLQNVADKVKIRIPLIPKYNTKEDQDRSVEMLKEMGFSDFDLFAYKTFQTKNGCPN